MTHRERVIAVLQKRPVDIIPSLGEQPMDITGFQNLFPQMTGDEVDDQLMIAAFFDNSAVDLDLEFKRTTLIKNENEHIYSYETGAVWRESYKPTFCREAIRYPINRPEDAFSFSMPPIKDDPAYRAELKRKIDHMHAAGYFVQGHVIGAWASVYYYLTDFENGLIWMIAEPEAAHRMFDLIAEYSLKTAELLLDCGADAVATISDLGSGTSLLFSRALFMEYVFPWLSALADLCHKKGGYLHFHSHGHIQDLMDDIVAAGVDIVNPVGPSDNNDLAYFKEKWGSRITILGGISTTIDRMTDEELLAHVTEVVYTGRKGGGFFPRTESGIPPMTDERLLKYLKILKRLRSEGYTDQIGDFKI